MIDGSSRSLVPRQCGVRQPDRPPQDSAWKMPVSLQAGAQAKAPGATRRSGKKSAIRPRRLEACAACSIVLQIWSVREGCDGAAVQGADAGAVARAVYEVSVVMERLSQGQTVRTRLRRGRLIGRALDYQTSRAEEAPLIAFRRACKRERMCALFILVAGPSYRQRRGSLAERVAEVRPFWQAPESCWTNAGTRWPVLTSYAASSRSRAKLQTGST
jgi:hypothetical protein